MDEELTNFFDFFLFCSLYVIATLATITWVTPWFGVGAVVALVVYVWVVNYFRQVSRESKRLESVSADEWPTCDEPTVCLHAVCAHRVSL